MDLSFIQSKIYDIRGVKVMLDYDLAEIYQVETRMLNQLTKNEFDNLKSQNVISSVLELINETPAYSLNSSTKRWQVFNPAIS